MPENMGRSISPRDELAAGMVDARGERCHICNAPSTHECDYCYRETCDACDVQCFECATLLGCVSCARGRRYCENCLPDNVLDAREVL